MRKLIVSAALFLLLIGLALTIGGCGDTTAFVPGPPSPATPSSPSAPAVAPMGAFTEGPVGFFTSSFIMYTATNDGSGLTKVSSQTRDYHSVYVLPDGSKAVFTAKAADGYSQIYYLSPVDSTTQRVQLTTTPLHKTSAMLSGDGSKIVFTQFPVQTGEYPVWDIAVMDTNGRNPYVIPAPAGLSFAHPSFSPDARKIVAAMGVGAFGADWYIYAMNADGSHLTKLTDAVPGEAPTFSPDGNQIVFGSTASGDTSIYIMNTDGSGLKRVGQQDSNWRDPLFVGDRIMFLARVHVNTDILSIKPDGTGLRHVTSSVLEDAFERGTPFD